ncbi:hypothetical protein [Persicirhabdus sediminis]|uniref:hypothetical protein n=1 Tax=Persicirhabdus sediminis TaxID=454144 RepID=UPI003CCD7E9B
MILHLHSSGLDESYLPKATHGKNEGVRHPSREWAQILAPARGAMRCRSVAVMPPWFQSALPRGERFKQGQEYARRK